MNASKEAAKAANEELEKAALLADKAIGNPAQLQELKRHLVRVQNFVEAAERKLPREASFNKDRIRKLA